MSTSSSFIRFIRSVYRCGLRDSFKQLCEMGDVKWGILRGSDEFGNRYYENDEWYPVTRCRWIRYHPDNVFGGIADPTSIPPLYFAWLHQITDKFPGIYPGRGSLRCQPDGRVMTFTSRKARVLQERGIHRRCVTWTMLHRKEHKKDLSSAKAKQLRLKVRKVERPIGTTTIEEMRQLRERAVADRERIARGRQDRARKQTAGKPRKTKAKGSKQDYGGVRATKAYRQIKFKKGAT